MARHVHELIVSTARDMAGALWEFQASNNVWYGKWQAKWAGLTGAELQAKFIDLKYPLLIDEARATLAQMLAAPLDEVLKETIHDALILDAELRRGRGQRTLLPHLRNAQGHREP